MISTIIVGITLHTEGEFVVDASSMIFWKTSNNVIPVASFNKDSPSMIAVNIAGPCTFFKIEETARASVGAMMDANSAPYTQLQPGEPSNPKTNKIKEVKIIAVMMTITTASIRE